MDDDYEHTNALEWDMNQRDERLRKPPNDSWQTVGKSKKQAKVRLLPPAAQPSTQPPLLKKQDRFAVYEKQGYPRGASQSSTGGVHHGQSPQPAPQAPKRTFENLAPQQNRSHQPSSQATQKFGTQQNRPKFTASFQPFPPKQNQHNQLQESHPQQSLSKGPQQEVMQRNGKQRQPPKLNAGSDNLGERLWRERGPAQAHIRIPVELASQDKGHMVTAKQHRTFILHEGKPGGNSSTEFGIWGDSETVKATVKDIRAWIEDWQSSSKSKRSYKFVKICSLTPALQARAERKWENDVKKHRFRQFPPPNKAFEAIGSFRWPVEQYKPEEILGSSYEALDPIRMDCKCYVVFDQEQGLFRILGKADAVKEGLARLRGTYFQVVARQRRPLERYLLHDADGESAGKCIVLKEYDRIPTVSDEGKEGVKIRYSPRVEGCDFEGSTSNEGTLRDLIISKLSKLHYYHGSIQMRIRLGTFLANRVMKSTSGTYAIDQYKAMIRESAFEGETTQELGDKAIEKSARATIQAADDFFQPRDPVFAHLNDVKPLCTAVFTFNDPTNSEAGNIRLTMIWQETMDANSTTPTYDQISKKWTRLDRDSGTPTSILVIGLSEIRTGVAWQFEIYAAQSIEDDKLPPGFSGFGDSIRPQVNAALKAANPSATEVSFVVYRPSFAHLIHLEQSLTYCYGATGTDYSIELSRFQHRSFAAQKASILAKPFEPTVSESRWGLSVRRIEWDTMFARNERLPIGERADWSHDEDVWFPSEWSSDEEKLPGFAQMMQKLKKVKTLVMETDEHDLMGGMKID